jgi:hypothetical protein
MLTCNTLKLIIGIISIAIVLFAITIIASPSDSTSLVLVISFYTLLLHACIKYYVTLILISLILSLQSTELKGTGSNELLNVTFGQRKGRWGIFFTFEPVCTLACRKNGKYSGRLYGGVCRCYCPRVSFIFTICIYYISLQPFGTYTCTLNSFGMNI